MNNSYYIRTIGCDRITLIDEHKNINYYIDLHYNNKRIRFYTR